MDKNINIICMYYKMVRKETKLCLTTGHIPAINQESIQMITRVQSFWLKYA